MPLTLCTSSLSESPGLAFSMPLPQVSPLTSMFLSNNHVSRIQTTSSTPTGGPFTYKGKVILHNPEGVEKPTLLTNTDIGWAVEMEWKQNRQVPFMLLSLLSL